MNRITTASSLAWLSLLTISSACTSASKDSQSLRHVDELLTHIERVHVESVVGKEKAHAAFDALNGLVAPDFGGDAPATHAELVAAIDQSELQAQTLRASIPPMEHNGRTVFDRWTADLEVFGNTRMRQRSQTRLEETRGRFQVILNAVKAAQLSYDAFNADLRDHALFLGHDFNTQAVSAIADDLLALKDQEEELDARFDACASAARAYVESSALHGQIESTSTNAQTADPAPEKPTQTAPARRRKPAPAKTAPATKTPPPVKPAPGQPGSNPSPAPSGSSSSTTEKPESSSTQEDAESTASPR